MSDLYFGEKSPTLDIVAEAMAKTDDTPSWQVIRGYYHPDTSNFGLVLISRGAVPTIESGIFEAIEGMVDLEDLEPEREGRLRDYGIAFEGDQDGLNIFVEIVCTKISEGAEGNRYIIKEMGGPLIWFDVLGSIAFGSRE